MSLNRPPARVVSSPEPGSEHHDPMALMKDAYTKKDAYDKMGFFDKWEQGLLEKQGKMDLEAQRPFQFDPRTGKKVYTDRANTLLEDRQAALDEMNDQVNKGWVKL